MHYFLTDPSLRSVLWKEVEVVVHSLVINDYSVSIFECKKSTFFCTCVEGFVVTYNNDFRLSPD
jgi:hypothetical protein